MGQVEFDNEGGAYARRGVSSESKGISGFVIRSGLAKDERQANYVMLGIIVVAIVLAIVIYVFGGVFSTTPSTVHVGPVPTNTPGR